MFNDKFDELAGNNGEEYLRHFGFTVEDLSFLISPQSSLSPIKKKQRNVFNFDGYQEEGDTSPPTSAREPPAPGTYGGTYPTVYQPSELFIKEESTESQMPLPSFDGLDLSCFDENQGKDVPPGPNTYSTAATAGSGASTIASEQVNNANLEDPRAAFARMGSSMNMGSLAFSTMSSFNFDEAEADEYLKGEAALNKISANNSHRNSINSDTVGIGMYPHPENERRSDIPPLPSLMQMTGGVHPSLICIEDASFIINAQQQHLNQQQLLIEQQQRAISGGQWPQPPHQQHQSGGDGSAAQPLSRIGSFKSNLPPLSVDLNALNAAHHAHHQAKLHLSGSVGGGSSTNTSAYSMMGFPGSTVSSNSGASSPERHSLTDGGPKKAERRSSESSVGGTAAGANAKEDASRASKSLATISRRFVEHFGDASTFDYISGRLHVDDVYDGAAVTNRVDGAAEVLGVHVRRIYELIKILEILSLVTFTGDKRGKFSWRGTKDFLMTLGAIQADGIVKYPDVAYSHGVRVASDLPSPMSSVPLYGTSPLTTAGNTPVNSQSSPFTYFDGVGGASGGLGNGGAFGSGLSLSADAMDGIADCGSASNDAYDRNSLSGHYLGNTNEADIMNIESLDFAQSPTGGIGAGRMSIGEEAVKSELDGGEMDSFVQQIAMLDGNHVDDGNAAASNSAPRQSKKRTALKKSSKGVPIATTPASTESHEEFMVEGICKSFLQLFLVGMDGLTMNYAIQRLVPMEANQTLSEYNKANATKIRRVYDVANVLCSLSLVNKVVNQKSKAAGKSSEVGTPDSSSSSYRESTTPRKDLLRTSLETGATATATVPSTSGKGGREGNSKADAKVLEWGSFAPSVIRDYYLNRLHSQS